MTKVLQIFSAALKSRGLSGALIVTPVNRFYLTGFKSSAGILAVPAKGNAILFTDFRYITAARRAGLDARDISELRSTCARWKKIGFETAISVDEYRRLEEMFKAQFVPVGKILAAIRSEKSAAEQRLIGRAIKANDAIFSELLPLLREGQTEREAADIIRSLQLKYGDGEAFDSIVCFGTNCAECHHEPSSRKLRVGDQVLVDMGVKVGGYCSDMTRSFVFKSEPPTFYREIHAIVLEANRLAIAAIRPGMTGREVDAIARNFIAEHGYGADFGHALGHSLGLEIHETPFFSPREETIIREGMIITVEPGIYIPRKVGVRIEDVVLVTATGCKTLTKSEPICYTR